MGGILVIAAAVLAARIVGWRGARLAGVAALAWAGVMAVALFGAASMAGRWVGVSPRVWAAVGVLGAIAIVYAGLVGWARRNARAAVAPLPAPSVAPPSDPPLNDPDAPLTDAELDRYARHIVLRELGGQGQRALKAARVLVVGAGGLGSPLLLYLAAAGVGRITVADDDTVGLSNLQRQVMFTTDDLDRPKVEAAEDAIARLNPHVAVTALTRRITADDTDLIAAHDLVLDGTDSFAVRAAVNAACVAAGTPLIAGSIAQWEGQLSLYDPARGGPCMACIFPEAPAPGLAPSCAEAGVVGALPGVIGGMMAIEAIKLLAGITRRGTGAGLRGQMILFDGLWGETRKLDIPAREDCPVCGGRGLHVKEGQTP